ncbi:Protein N-acetyltransferase, RimJ/RimL family [Quadrisphaera granulorum]|uniref:RimJ/RimL family protein N-acetyltransferase n=1 Tax=Quadrisphaera granulorum TaxID=317664 RepID=A0A315ZNH1_9ACTN|nr:GNAT family protein [Quadrisphaera granulorum]PWJ47046.1 RimJ/RimL family protein N-acetyltransferase [Quadrisphaera granulorum]SZE98947.1 Protein N-acetyltransferase, RimJ/RimL family [Quadrisphaera granulorum]
MFSLSIGPDAELRPLEVWHTEELADHLDRAREHIRPWVGPSFVTDTVEGAAATLSRYATATATDGARLYGIWCEGRLVGGVMFVAFSAASGVCEIGCWLEPGAEGRGLVSAAVGRLLDWALLERGLNRAEWRCRADNVRSAAVAQRLGMTLEGTLRGTWRRGDTFHDTQVWALLQSERRQASPSSVTPNPATTTRTSSR